MQKRQKERGEEIIILYRELVMLLDSSKSAYHMTATCRNMSLVRMRDSLPKAH